MITYEDNIIVRLDGKIIGTIKSVKGGGYRYHPKGSKVTGDLMATIQAVKGSLERE